jgi:hypothetical protein
MLLFNTVFATTKKKKKRKTPIGSKFPNGNPSTKYVPELSIFGFKKGVGGCKRMHTSYRLDSTNSNP